MGRIVARPDGVKGFPPASELACGEPGAAAHSPGGVHGGSGLARWNHMRDPRGAGCSRENDSGRGEGRERPAGMAGGLAHCEEHRSAAVARRNDTLTPGIDAEPHEPPQEGAVELVAITEEPAPPSGGAGSFPGRCGGARGIRTPDLLIANETRYQLRHSPKCGMIVAPRSPVAATRRPVTHTTAPAAAGRPTRSGSGAGRAALLQDRVQVDGVELDLLLLHALGRQRPHAARPCRHGR